MQLRFRSRPTPCFAAERALRDLLLASFGTTLLVAGVGSANVFGQHFSSRFESFVLVATVVAAAGIAYVLLWHFSQRQRDLIQRAEVARAEAEAANGAKDEVLAMLGHELRNPLAPIVTAVDVIRLRGAATREVEIIDRQVRHLCVLVDDLLDVARIARGMVELRLAPVELAKVVVSGVEMSSPILERRNHRIDIDVPTEGLLLEVDERRIAQVVSNLLTNAAKYTPPGGRISICAARSNDHAELVVADNGEGIAPELLPRLFEPFVQGPQALSRDRGGLGLGLTLVRSLVECHRGTVQAASEGRGLGARFTITLPLASAHAIAPPSEPQSRSNLPPSRILVVDDNRDFADLLVSALHGEGHETIVATNGWSALDATATRDFDVAILDIGLPGMDGYELGRLLRARKPGIQTIALTALAGDHHRDRSREAGFVAHVVKPAGIRDILDVIARQRRASIT